MITVMKIKEAAFCISKVCKSALNNESSQEPTVLSLYIFAYFSCSYFA